jgi:hypothetical protein
VHEAVPAHFCVYLDLDFSSIERIKVTANLGLLWEFRIAARPLPAISFLIFRNFVCNCVVNKEGKREKQNKAKSSFFPVKQLWEFLRVN